MSSWSLTATYSHMSAFVTGRMLDASAVRTRLRRLDEVAFFCIGLVVVGLVLEDHAVGFANGARLVTLGVIGEFVVHWLYARATKREQYLSDVESDERALTIERLRQGNLELWQRIQPRDIPYELEDSLRTALAAFAGQHFELWANASGPDASVFAPRLFALLVSAGWVPKRDDVEYAAILGLVLGVEIRVGHSPRAAEAGTALHLALSTVPIASSVAPIHRYSDVAYDEDVLKITVGVKPPREVSA